MEWMALPSSYPTDLRAISLSEKEYEQPLRYWPERFMNKDLHNPLAGHWAFGPGTTSCPHN